MKIIEINIEKREIMEERNYKEYYKDITERSITPEYFLDNFFLIEDACVKMHEGFGNWFRIRNSKETTKTFNPLKVINFKLNPWANDLNDDLKLFLKMNGYEYENIKRVPRFIIMPAEDPEEKL